MNFITKNPIFIIRLILFSVTIIGLAIWMGGWIPFFIDMSKEQYPPKKNNNTRHYILMGVGGGLVIYTLLLWLIVKLILITIKKSMK